MLVPARIRLENFDCLLSGDDRVEGKIEFAFRAVILHRELVLFLCSRR